MAPPNVATDSTPRDRSQDSKEPVDDSKPTLPAESADSFIESDLLVEDVSIDGMCGVY